MRTTCLFAAVLWLAGIASAQAQRRIRIGPTYSSLSLEDQSGSSYSFPSYGGSVALITGDESETGLTIARYNNLSTDHGIRRLTLFGLDSYYYPVGPRGVVAPFALTALGLARVTEIDSLCLVSIISCNASASATSQLALAFGLGVRVNVGGAAVATLAGRFLEVPGSQIQALEAVANASVALGGVPKGQLLAGTLGPVVSAFIPISGPLRGRSPFAGVRFRRDTKKARSEEHTSELQSPCNLVCRLLLEKKKNHLLPPPRPALYSSFFFFFNDTATTEIYTLSLHDALPISHRSRWGVCLKDSCWPARSGRS